MNLIQSTTAALTLIGTVGGGIYYMDVQYARRQWAEEQITGLQDQYRASRLNIVDNQIIALEQEKRRRRLSQIEENLLRRLYLERRQLVCQLGIEKC